MGTDVRADSGDAANTALEAADEAIRAGQVAGHVRDEIRRARRLRVTASPEVLMKGRGPGEHPDSDRFAALAACLVGGHTGRLSDVASALGLSIAAVRESLAQIAECFAAVGGEDGVEVCLVPLPVARPALDHLRGARALAPALRRVAGNLDVRGYVGRATRKQVEAFRGEDSEALLRRLVDAGYLAKDVDELLPHRTNLYPATPQALAAVGHPTPEYFRRWCQSLLTKEEVMSLGAREGGDAADNDRAVARDCASVESEGP